MLPYEQKNQTYQNNKIYIHLYSPMNGRKNAKQYKNNAVTLTIKCLAVSTVTTRVRMPCIGVDTAPQSF